MDKRYKKHFKDELTDHLIYTRLAAREKQFANKTLLEKLAAQEAVHYDFWRSLVPDPETVSPNQFFIFMNVILRSIFGVTFTVKFLELHRERMVSEYNDVLESLSGEQKERLGKIISDEKHREQNLISQIKERRTDYVGFIALGLADAIVEITGVHAGFLGVTGSTLIAGISGILVGFAAAISMGSAAYLQAKQDPDKSGLVSALTTGISYFFSAILLAFPYFLIHTMITAFVVSSFIGVILLAAFSFYGSIIFDRKFIREFSESVGLMLGTALATYLLGTAVGRAFHVGANSF